MGSDVQDYVRKQLVKHLVQRNIFCPVSGLVLDVRHCVVIVDSDGDPTYVLHQKGWRQFSASTEAVEKLAASGLSVDERTVKS